MIEVGEFREGMPLSELIQLAVNDVRKALDTGAYVLDGCYWHEPSASPNGKCAICLGGGILAGIFKFDARFDIDGNWSSLEEWQSTSIEAMDRVRLGEVGGALDQLGKKHVPHAAVVNRARALICEHYRYVDAIAPLETYEAAAQILAEVGL